MSGVNGTTSKKNGKAVHDVMMSKSSRLDDLASSLGAPSPLSLILFWRRSHPPLRSSRTPRIARVTTAGTSPAHTATAMTMLPS